MTRMTSLIAAPISDIRNEYAQLLPAAEALLAPHADWQRTKRLATALRLLSVGGIALVPALALPVLLLQLGPLMIAGILLGWYIAANVLLFSALRHHTHPERRGVILRTVLVHHPLIWLGSWGILSLGSHLWHLGIAVLAN